MEGRAVPSPRCLAPAAQRLSDLAPTHTVAGELHQIRAYNDSIRTRLNFLDQALGPSLVDDVGEIKRGMKDSHRRLEKLQKKAGDRTASGLMQQATKEAWESYQRMVTLEARLKDLELRRPAVYVTTGARHVDVVEEVIPSWFREGNSSSGPSMGSGSTSSSILMPLPVPAGAGGVEVDQNREGYERGKEPSTYMMSGALPHAHTYVRHAEIQNVHLLEASSNYSEEPRDDISNNSLQRSPGVAHTVRLSGQHGIPPKLARTRAEVKRSCWEEEFQSDLQLRDPDRRREGSTTAFFAVFSIMSGIDDPEYYLPRFLHIKIHEVKRLKEWLQEKNYLQRSGNISRIEKLLHLLFLLQDGLRFETVATLFSRAPKQVEATCKEVFEGLLEMHSETALPHRQPACDHLWGISKKYFNVPVVAQTAERYYGWWLADVLKVLVTLNLYIGRYRKQGHVALSGEYFKWWESFKDEE
jgi:hypothetical protein